MVDPEKALNSFEPKNNLPRSQSGDFYEILAHLINDHGEYFMADFLNYVVTQEIRYLPIIGASGGGKTITKHSIALWLAENAPEIHQEFLSYDRIHSDLEIKNGQDRFWGTDPLYWWEIDAEFERRLKEKEAEILELGIKRYIFLIETPAINENKSRGWQFIKGYLLNDFKDKTALLVFVISPNLSVRAARQRSRAAIATKENIDDFVEYLRTEGLDISADLQKLGSVEDSFLMIQEVLLRMANLGFMPVLWQEMVDQARLWDSICQTNQTSQSLCASLKENIVLSKELENLNQTQRDEYLMVMAFWNYLFLLYKLRPEQAHVVYAELIPDNLSIPLLMGDYYTPPGQRRLDQGWETPGA